MLSHERLNIVMKININKFKAEIYLGIQTQAGVVMLSGVCGVLL